MNACPRCRADLDYGHDRPSCVALGESIQAAVEHAQQAGLSTAQAAALTGSMSGYIPPGSALTAAAIAALDAWRKDQS